jgi:hypothetical protein
LPGALLLLLLLLLVWLELRHAPITGRHVHLLHS